MAFSLFGWRSPILERRREEFAKRRTEAVSEITPVAQRQQTAFGLPGQPQGQEAIALGFSGGPQLGPISSTQPFESRQQQVARGGQEARRFQQAIQGATGQEIKQIQALALSAQQQGITPQQVVQQHLPREAGVPRGHVRGERFSSSEQKLITMMYSTVAPVQGQEASARVRAGLSPQPIEPGGGLSDEEESALKSVLAATGIGLVEYLRASGEERVGIISQAKSQPFAEQSGTQLLINREQGAETGILKPALRVAAGVERGGKEIGAALTTGIRAGFEVSPASVTAQLARGQRPAAPSLAAIREGGLTGAIERSIDENVEIFGIPIGPSDLFNPINLVPIPIVEPAVLRLLSIPVRMLVRTGGKVSRPVLRILGKEAFDIAQGSVGADVKRGLLDFWQESIRGAGGLAPEGTAVPPIGAGAAPQPTGFGATARAVPGPEGAVVRDVPGQVAARDLGAALPSRADVPVPTRAAPAEAAVPASVAPARGAPSGRAPEFHIPRSNITSDGRPVHALSVEEVDALLAREIDIERNGSKIVFGEEGAKRYDAAQRTSNSTIASRERQDAAFRITQEMEAGLTPEQNKILFGIGEDGPNVEELRDMSRSLHDLDFSSASDLADSLKFDVTRIRPGQDPMELLGRDLIAHMRLRMAFERAASEGLDLQEVSRLTLQKAAARFDDPEDAAFILQDFMRAAQEPPGPPAPSLPAPARAVEPGAAPAVRQAAPAPPPVKTRTLEGVDVDTFATEREIAGIREEQGGLRFGEEAVPENIPTNTLAQLVEERQLAREALASPATKRQKGETDRLRTQIAALDEEERIIRDFVERGLTPQEQADELAQLRLDFAERDLLTTPGTGGQAFKFGTPEREAADFAARGRPPARKRPLPAESGEGDALDALPERLDLPEPTHVGPGRPREMTPAPPATRQAELPVKTTPEEALPGRTVDEVAEELGSEPISEMRIAGGGEGAHRFSAPVEDLLARAEDIGVDRNLWEYGAAQSSVRAPEVGRIKSLFNRARSLIDPALSRNPDVNVSHLAGSRYADAQSQRIITTTAAFERAAQDAFGEAATGGVADSLRYVGPPVEGKAIEEYIGTAWHYLDNPKLYRDATPAQQRLAAVWDGITRNELRFFKSVGGDATEWEGFWISHTFKDPERARSALTPKTGAGRAGRRPGSLKERRLTTEQFAEVGAKNDLEIETDITTLLARRLTGTAQQRSNMVFLDELAKKVGGGRLKPGTRVPLGETTVQSGGTLWRLPDDIASDVNQAIGRGPLQPDEQLVGQVVDATRATLLNLDFSVGGMRQGYLAFVADPIGAIKSYGQAAQNLMTKDGFLQWMVQNAERAEYWSQRGLQLRVSPLDIRSTLRGQPANLVDRLPVIAQLNHVQFEVIMPLQKLGRADHMLGVLQLVRDRRGLAGVAQNLPIVGPLVRRLGGNLANMTDDDLAKVVADAANNWMGGIEWERVGAKPSVLRRLAILTEGWTRAQVGNILNAPKLSPKGIMARQLIMKEVALTASLSTALSLALTGELPNYNPLSVDWLDVVTPVGRISILPHKTLLRTVVRGLAGKPPDEFGPGGFLAERLDAALKFADGRTGQFPRLAVDLIDGKDYFGRPIGNKVLHVIKESMPIIVGQVWDDIEQGASLGPIIGRAIAEFSGGSAKPFRFGEDLSAVRDAEFDRLGSLGQLPNITVDGVSRQPGDYEELREHNSAATNVIDQAPAVQEVLNRFEGEPPRNEEEQFFDARTRILDSFRAEQIQDDDNLTAFFRFAGETGLDPQRYRELQSARLNDSFQQRKGAQEALLIEFERDTGKKPPGSVNAAVEEFFGVDPARFTDPVTRDIEPAFYDARERALEDLSEADRASVFAIINKNRTPVQRDFENLRREDFGRGGSLSEYYDIPPDHRTERDSYRQHHPEVDAVLFVTGSVSTLKSSRAHNEANRMVRRIFGSGAQIP